MLDRLRWKRLLQNAKKMVNSESFEFAERLDSQVMNKRQIENLARAGAFDNVVPNRRQVYEAVEMLVRHTNAMQNERESNQ